jgi:hypothetical protein
MQATYSIDKSSLVHTTPQDKPQASKATKLLQLELHKLATKQGQQHTKQEDNKVGVTQSKCKRGFGMLYRGTMIEPTKVNTKIAKEIIKHRGEIQLIKHN